MVYIDVDDLVTSGRGPPRAGPDSDVIAAPRRGLFLAPRPAIESQIVPQSSHQVSIPSHHTNALRLIEPQPAAGLEGTAARPDPPSFGDPL
jgi:hypothetical protein